MDFKQIGYLLHSSA